MSTVSNRAIRRDAEKKGAKRRKPYQLVVLAKALEKAEIKYSLKSFRGGARVCVQLDIAGPSMARQAIWSFIHPTKRVTRGRIATLTNMVPAT